MHVTTQKLLDYVFSAIAQMALIFALWLMLPAVNVQAAIYACPTGNGDTAYQDRPCEQVKTPEVSKSADVEDAQHPRTGYPLGLHPSWFIAPAYAPQPAYCDRLGCDCASQARNFRHGLDNAVADALFLEATWHRYSEQVITMETDPPTGLAYLQLQVNIEESACDIQMSQATIRNYVVRAMKTLEKKSVAAERRGNTDFSQCEDPASVQCKDVEAYQLYQRVLMDLETLRSPRSFFMAEAG